MFNPFGALGDMAKLQQQAKKMQEDLKKETVEINRNGVRVVVRGDQAIMEIEVDGVLENRIAQVVNEAIRKTQEVAARKLMEMSNQK
ncbi:MAG: YbaB/EbfC family nucleoid-associated protein [Patescibacteria group bacterium]|nr:YbaB/EbfC family nucleoid-associated protein [Patescibacteria group bacterium]